jgi:type IV pilus assembly protein PilM
MNLPWATRNVRPIAVDFGSDRLKLLQITMDDPPRLVAAASVEVPVALRDAGEEKDDFLATSLRDLLKRGGFQGRRAILAVPSSLTHIQHVRIGKGEAEGVDQQVAEELRGKLPVDPASLVIRNVRVGEVFAEGAARQEIISMAATRQTVMRCIGLAGKARLTVVGMHCEPLAITQAFAHLYRRDGDEQRNTFFVDIGQATTKALIAHGSRLVFAKSIGVAGEHFDRLMARSLDVELDEARKRRHEQAAEVTVAEPVEEPAPAAAVADRRGSGGAGSGLAMLDAAVEAEGSGATAAASGNATPDAEMLDCLIDELQLCLGYYTSMYNDRPVERIVFLGGQANQRRMCQKIAQALRLPAQVGDPLTRVQRASDGAGPIDVDLRQSQPGWAVPMGLSLLPTNL